MVVAVEIDFTSSQLHHVKVSAPIGASYITAAGRIFLCLEVSEMAIRKLTKYIPTKFMAEDSHYDKGAADYAVAFIEALCHTKGTWAGKPFELIDWQEQIIRDLFGILKPNGYRQFNTA